ncbi:hypothetical protein APT_02411 [Acetobacter pasteurianus NBRC 101655]|uniref:DUF192 domain-containing protein n=1 Tax=Acetobacter pasteurianus (strain NBRC 105184 / IFO 3283-01) TaxID=634452 RepID=C7JFV2_ACEP3|nr:DUF192 domain-containing protein [Acetobacter pasteurianus]BAU39493.1 hypothetical protein APT_02411 [Acetobacter pasteurianus NBRC 101655]QHM91706.1 DUF192 domain-containing protein [Acetobacter pasteurianus]CCT59312.1 hypothetical protein APA386B_1217 [Acetobacter pasteurianus 386B]BAI00522.1 hypothetical protein APA01_24150 [Acetobacter pasteurianus IFO 3283-01]BAI03573.1 hypothetical protein APA03_24150 [Acetobacter pasteurianus IFO 3283-03]
MMGPRRTDKVLTKKLLGLMAACMIGGAAGSLLPAYAEETGEPTQAQAELPREELAIVSPSGRHVFSVELAKTPREQQVGEMFRQHLPENSGMLFVWKTPQQSDMWMENTLIPLDIVFIDADHRIQAITENAVPRSLARISSHGPVAATLELAGGVTAKFGITVGDKVEAPSLGKKL